MDNKINKNGFSLIEIIVSVGIFVFLIQGAYVIGLTEYKNYVLNSEKSAFVSTLLESRSRAMALGQNFEIQGIVSGVFSAQGLFFATSTDLQSTSTIIQIGNSEINIDQYGFINGQ